MSSIGAMSEETTVRTLNQTLDLCLRVGELLLASGAGAADVTATVQSLARSLGMRNVDVDITFTSLSMTRCLTWRSWISGASSTEGW